MLMKPFRNSFTARALTAAASFALIGAGLIPVLGLPERYALPIVFLLSVGTGIVAMVMGANDYPGTVALLGFILPMAFWAYVCGALLVVTAYPSYGWVLVSLGGLPVMLLIGSLGVEREPAATVTARRAA
jgi:hypothetical protein